MDTILKEGFNMKKKMKNLLCLLLAAALGLTGCGSSFQEEAVLKINGREIMKSEYMVYLYTTTQSFVSAAGTDVWTMDFDGQTADELVEERTIQTLQSVLAAEDYAEANGITLTEEQKNEAKLSAEQFVASVAEEDLDKMGVDEESVLPLMEASYLYALVYDTISAECEVDAEAMEAFRTENEALLKEDYTEVRLQTILLDDEKKAEKAVERARAGENFQTLYEEYDIVPQSEDGEDRGEMTMYQSYLKMSFGLTEDLAEGEIVGPIQADKDRYFVLKATEVDVPTAAELEQIAEAVYRSQVQTEYANARMEEMVQAQTVEKMEGVWENMEKFH